MAYNCGQHSLRSASFLLILFYLQFCFSADTITFNKPIQDPERLVSNNGNFILGFFSPDNTTNRYLGILLNDSSNEAVWVANRDTPLNDFSGIVKIHEDGNLVVLNGLNEILWSTNISNAAANSSAQLLDNGNIVLLDSSNRRNIWESFKHPVHSFMKYMRLGSNKNTKVKDLLTSWTSPSNPSPGMFTAGLDYSIPPQIFIWNGSQPHWRSGPWNGQFFIGVPNMDGNYAYPHSFGIEEDKDGTVYITLRSAQDAYIPYYVLNYEGKLLAKVFLVRKKNWEVSWTSQESECSRYGKCGPFGICNPVDAPICWCLRGFEPRDIVEWNRGNWTGGCTRRTRLQCQRNNSVGQESKRDGFLKLDTMKVPDFAQQISVDTEMECVRRCSSDCSCIAYAYDGGIRCMHWNVSLTDLHKFSSGGASLYVRLADSELDKREVEMSGLSKRRKQKQMTVTATTVIIGSLTITLFSYFVWWRINKQKGRKQKKGYGDNIDQVDLQELPLFEFQEIANATDNFNCLNKLGEGGFGPVFRGKMPNGQEIAVKRLSTFSSQGMEEFMNEVVVISKLQHRNLVRLLGCSVERGEKMLVYEYMPNKSLDTLLFGSDKEEVHWSRRAKIIEGISRGLLYLHRDSRLRIIHRDLKLGNILLDEELNPKISDFGMARIFGANQHQANTRRVVGTYGYMAPEYAMQGKFSEKSDVYSFGILVLEIASGRKNSSFYQQEMSLVSFVWKMWNENSIVALLDPTISDPQFRDEILRHVHVGLLCVQEFPKDRPTISTVLSMLSSEIMDLPTPKQPAFTIRQNSSETESSKKSDMCLSNNITLSIIEGR